jgi:hypothetical protein
VSIINQNRKFQRGEQVTDAKLNEVAGTATISNLQNADFKSDCALVDTKLATISTAGKVNSTALVTTSAAAGDFLYNTGTALERLPVGTAGQRLQVPPTLDYMEYATDALAQAAYATNTTQTLVPQAEGTIINDFLNGDASQAFDGVNPQALIDYKVNGLQFYVGKDWGAGVTKIITGFKVWGVTTYGFNVMSPSAGNVTVTLQGSQNGTDWTGLGSVGPTTDSASLLMQKLTGITTTTAYRYHRLLIDAYDAGNSGQVAEVEFYQDPLQSYSEATIKTQGSYALKSVAAITESATKTLTRTVSPTIDLTGVNTLKFDIYAGRSGANIKIGIYDATVPTTTEKTYTVIAANTWETVTWDISGVADANKNAISKIIITIVNADATNTFYLDNFYVASPALRWVTP